MEVSIGGWIVVFLTRIRQGSVFTSGMPETGFGSASLSVASSWDSFRLVSARSCLWLSMSSFPSRWRFYFGSFPSLWSRRLRPSLAGFFMGTIFPGVILVATGLLPKNLHITAIGSAAALSMGRGAVFPFMIGAIAQANGVSTMQPILLAMLVVVLGNWVTLFGFLGEICRIKVD
ncbi:hypothetical protein BBP40_003838 [Aspergillus hancockii]|nr:hypothetical protein BBP40_003838 [Aspergillus hancockii]